MNAGGRRGERSVVLYYHRAATPACDPFQLAVAPERLSEHLDVINELAEPAPLDRLVDRATRSRAGGQIAVTFDDGYADNLLEAAPRLANAGVPATVFVTSSVLGGGELWWDRLSHLFAAVDPALRLVTLPLDGPPLRVDVGSEAARNRALQAVRARLFRRTPAAIDDALGAVARALEVTESRECAEHRMLNEAELRDLAATPGIEIGSHTVSHPRLSALSPEEQVRELTQSRADLEAVIGTPVDSFAFPFGERASYDRTTIAAVRRAGYSRSFTTDHGPVGWWSSRARLPRYRVENWTGAEFRTALLGWLGRS